ncbi:GGDEF domain-containing protein [Endothiovibrio diazotrophicus]
MKDQYKFRNELLKQYVYLGLAVSLLIAPVEYAAGLHGLGATLNVFSLITFYLVFSARSSARYLFNSRLFMAAIFVLFTAGFVWGDHQADNKYFLLLFPIASFSIRGVKEGTVWSALLLALFIALYFAFPADYFPYSFLFFVVAFFMVAYLLYFYRHFEMLNFHHIHQVHQELETSSRTDFLTGLANRLRLDAVLEEEQQRSRRFHHPFGVILLDVDHFKRVNDGHGHPVGDQVLVELAGLLRENVRETDTVGRWGGEEFMVLCPETDLEEAAALAGALRRVVEAHPFPVVGRQSASFGVAACRPGDPVDAVVRRADEALYAAKARGRNRVETTPDDPSTTLNGIG